MNLLFNWYEFHQLTPDLLYDLLKLRQDVFVIEQACLYPELDGKDKQALHLVGTCDGVMVAGTRVLPAGIAYPEPSLGRVVIHRDWRGRGLGHQLLKETLAGIAGRWGDVAIRISAQAHLRSYYEAAGFAVVGESYLEDGIPHFAMIRPAKC